MALPHAANQQKEPQAVDGPCLQSTSLLPDPSKLPQQPRNAGHVQVQMCVEAGDGGTVCPEGNSLLWLVHGHQGVRPSPVFKLSDLCSAVLKTEVYFFYRIR